jgi:CrcB protein
VPPLLTQTLAVGLAGFVGAVARFLLGLSCARLFGPGFPIGTMIINLTGSFFLGWFATYSTTRAPISDTLRLAIGVGFVGAYTTFSTLTFDTHVLWQRGDIAKAAVNLVGSLALGMVAVHLGIALARR